ncbi:MAG TPA: enoyl-CoA hydratase/isomerase family protein [Dehalococcoidia bacterium]|nr:enoyl-CoA hydratase/isomerase family protein [Dehalococcoidia bacterium]
MDYQTVTVERKDHIGNLTLNRPQALNVLNLQMLKDINSALLELEADSDVRVIIMKGAGRAFCAGIDIKEFPNKGVIENRSQIAVYDSPLTTIATITKPVIAQVHGYATAAGCGLVAGCDLAVASEDTYFGTTAINVGLFCLGPSAPLSRCVGRKKSLEMLLTGDLIDAQEAYRVGLINKVVPIDKLETAAMELAQKIASKSPVAIQIGKRAFYTMSDLEYSKALNYLSEMMATLSAAEDAREGIAAFLEKRTPEWKGY